MVKKTYILFLCLVLFLLVLALFYIKKKQIEAFTPEVRKLVRPHLRSMRLTGDGYKTALKDQAAKLFNMFGLQFA